MDTTPRKYGPNYFYLFILIAGFAFFVFLSTLAAKTPVNNQSRVALIPVLIRSIFLLFALIILFQIVSFKTIELDNESLLISKPLIFYRKQIFLKDIRSISETNENVDLSANRLGQNNLLIGKKATMLLVDETSIRLSSLEIWHYSDLMNNISRLRRR